MQYCENCGALLRENAKFCDQCGASVKAGEEVKKYCKNCQAQLEPGALFCPECGYRVVEEPEPSNPDSSILEPQNETKLLGQAEGPFACRMQGTENLSEFGLSLLIYEERLELWKGIREQNPRLIIQMRDISLVQNRKVNALTNGCILLLMKNGEKISLNYTSGSINPQAENAAALIRSCLD